MKVKFIYKIDGVVVSEAEHKRRSRAVRGVARISRAYEKPLVSKSGGCHASQVEQKNKFLESRGVKGARFQADGTVAFESRGARNDFLRARGLIDQDGGYGDHC